MNHTRPRIHQSQLCLIPDTFQMNLLTPYHKILKLNRKKLIGDDIGIGEIFISHVFFVVAANDKLRVWLGFFIFYLGKIEGKYLFGDLILVLEIIYYAGFYVFRSRADTYSTNSIGFEIVQVLLFKY